MTPDLLTLPTTTGHDPRLGPWLAAVPGSPAAERALAGLLEGEAGPVIARLVRRKFGGWSPDAEDVASEARFQLARRLERLRADPPDGRPLADFPAYAAAVTYTAWADSLRRRHPARAMLLNRLRYLLENRAAGANGPRGFALWTGPDGERLAGFAAWRDAHRPPDPTPRRRWLLVDARAAAAEAFTGRGIPADLAGLTAGLLVWLGSPLELGDLVNVVAEILDLAAPAVPSDDEENEAREPGHPDPRPSPHDTLRWKEYLGWLWRETTGLPLRQRTAFLLHASLLREMELLGLTGIRAAATALELPPERMAELWPRLPLDDLAIGAILGAERQQVINLRKVARGTLGRAWAAWLGK